MEIQLKFSAASDVGLVRKSNQDSGYASQTLFAVADGMGGAAAGDLASAVTVAHIAAADGNFKPDELLPRLRNALNAAHAELVVRSTENPQLAGMGTTCVALLRSGNKLAMTHIGDSRAYLLRGGRLTQITHDHTLVQYLVDSGQITAEEAKTHPKRNVIMRALGDDPAETEIAIDESIREAVPGDRWLLCSDGLYGPVSMQLIHATLSNISNLDDCAQALIGHALAGGAPDNVTVVLADVISVPDGATPPAEFTQPRTVGAAAVRKIKIREHLAPSNPDFPESGAPGDGNSGQLGGSALVNEPDDPALRVGIDFAQEAAGTPLDSASKNLFTGQNSHELIPIYTDINENNAALPVPKKRRRFGKILASFSVILLLAAGIFSAYVWSQTKYYVAPSDGYIGIYQGVPTEIGPIKLSHLKERSATRIADLSDFVQTRLKTPITRDSLSEAREVVENLNLHKKAAAE
ncbi:protein phosphatase 2C domain-containing protein [Arcanobacterium hippocoleae]